MDAGDPPIAKKGHGCGNLGGDQRFKASIQGQTNQFPIALTSISC